ncbi:undecaprenyl-diphosphate phosphatase [Thalassolituus marinus]|uniref:Undecaprenyl-diphosphatase n=1 Tax=Thalassolituus marinus TaxID=671053 RepID=A0ABS7ZTL8_9GAMM|nr:undecaprenyl-diphosphate phosphatase [Thalassolituus marinus]MCA6064517.1 undecaprenyl-diphosphate phosphatase [Thalassolituus marinus]
MDLIEIVVLALLQGLTEFLPISSSAHLILPSEVFGWQDQGLAFDVAVHVGTLLAVMLYFRKDIVALISGWLTTGFSRSPNADGRLAWFVALATIPAGLAGLLLDDWIEANLRTVNVIAWTTIGFGILLGVADRRTGQTRSLATMTLWMALVIGLAQALALVPGTSRSGITITAALFVGLQRVDAARFSFLLSIPLILAAGGLKSLELAESVLPVDWSSILLGVAISAVSAWLCIYYFLAFINRIGMMPFVIYRLILGGVLFLFFT